MDLRPWLHALSLPAPRRREFLRRALDDPDPSALPLFGLSTRERREAEAILAATEAAGGSVLTARDDLYPISLQQLADAPLVLFLKGEDSLLERARPRVAVVGARRGTARGRRVAEDLGADLARAGVVVVSGLALGVDGAAHRGALRAGGLGIGVIATGIDRVHPPSHRSLQESLAGRGLLVSEQPPGTPALPHQFVARNRILAGLADALVVVEAGERSGALSTVDFALQMGREVLCVPGPVDCPHARGTLRLMREGATLVRHAADVLESLGWQQRRVSGAEAPLGLGREPETVASIAARLGRPLPEILAALVELELEGRVRREPGDRWRVTS